MRYVTVTAALILSTLVGPLPAFAGQNLAPNPSFDYDNAFWIPGDTNVDSIFRPDTGSTLEDGSGPGSLEIRFFQWNGASGGSYARLPVTAGHTYEFGASYFRPSADNVSSQTGLYATWLDDQGYGVNYTWLVSAYPLVDDAWTRISGSVEAPAGATHVNFTLLVGNPYLPGETRPGVAYFDDVYFGEQGEGTAIQELFIPAGASAAGDKGTFWTTELWVHNAVLVPITLEGAVLEANKDNSAAIAAPTQLTTVPALGFVALQDVFGTLGKSVTGGLYLRATAQSDGLPATLVVVMSRTSTPNPEGGGSYGQALPAVGPGEKGLAISPGVFQSADYRTNVGVLNTSASQIELDVDVRDSAGVDVRTARWTLRPYEFKLRSVSSLGVSSLDGGTVYFILRSASGSFRAFTSTADNITGDSVYNAAQ